MQISRASMYAIGAMLQLAELPSDVPIPSSRLAKAGEMPERFLLQVLRSLVNSELLESTRGTDGGYSLARAANQISLLQILEAADGPMTSELPPVECVPRATQVHLQETLTQITANTRRHLAGVLLTDLIVPRAGEEFFVTSLGQLVKVGSPPSSPLDTAP